MNKYHTVPYRKQNNSYTCWFASLRMVVRWRFDQFFSPPNKAGNALYEAGYRTIAKKLFDDDYDMHWDTTKGSVHEGMLPLSMSDTNLMKVCEKLGMHVRELPTKKSNQTLYIDKVRSMLDLSPILWPGWVNGYRGYNTPPAGMRNSAAPQMHMVVITGYERYQGVGWFLINDPYIDPGESEDEQGEIYIDADELWSQFMAKKVAIWQNPI